MASNRFIYSIWRDNHFMVYRGISQIGQDSARVAEGLFLHGCTGIDILDRPGSNSDSRLDRDCRLKGKNSWICMNLV